MSKTLGKRKGFATAANAGPKAQFKKPWIVRKPKQSLKAMVAAAVRSVAETKFFDSDITNQTPTTGAQLDSLMVMGAAVDEVARIGNKINVVSTGYKFTGSLDGDESVGNQLRVILAIDHQANAALAMATTILQTDAFDSYYNMDNVDRFTILDDRIIDFPAYAGIATAVVPQPVSVNVYKKLKDLGVTYASNAAVVPNTNNLICLQIGRNGGGTYRMQFRSRFTDA